MEPTNSLSRRSALSLAAAVGFLATAVPALPGLAPGAAAATAANSASGLRSIAPGAGVKRVYKDVFKAASFLDMILVPDPKGVPKLVTATTGNTNQFQIFDAATGKREYAFTTPDGDKINSSLAWDAATGTVYAGSGGGKLIAWSFATKKLVSLGKVAPSATAVYGFDIDSSGRVWGGSYPDGIIWNYNPKTKKFASLSALDAATDYVKAIAVWKETVFVGTGSVTPHMVSFPVNNPGKRTVIKLPDGGPTGFVHRIISRGDKLFVFAEDSTLASRCYIYDPAKAKWEGKYALPSASKAFAEKDGPSTWHTAQASLVKTNTTTMAATILCPTNVASARAVIVSGDKIFVAGTHEGKPVVGQYSIKAKKETSRVTPQVLYGSLGVQSLIGSDHELLYFGAYQGDGLASLNPDTDARWQSSNTVGISQIEHLMQYDKNRLYIGSYGSAKLYSFDRNRIKEGDAAFTHITTLRKPYMQSRPFAWGAAGGKVLAGTVPEYGFRGGALAAIDPVKNKLGLVMNKFIPEQSIVGLAGYGDVLYGTTSGCGGYGIDDYTGAAAVFAYNPKTEKTLWVSYLKGHRDLYSPILIGGVLYVATINGLLALNPSTGKLTETLEVRSRTARPGYQSARALRIPGTNKIVHSSGSIVLLIDVAERTQSVLAKSGFGTPIAVMPDGRVFVSHQSNHIAELHTGPNPTISSPSDLVTINAAGELMIAASNGAGGYAKAVKAGSGWSSATIRSFHVADWNGDGILDIIIQRTSGALEVHYGKVNGGFEKAFKAATGWGSKKMTVGPWTNAVYPTVIGVDAAGEVRRHPVGANGTIGSGFVLGSGWKGREIAMIDMNGDGKQGLLGRSGAKLIFQPSNGKGSLSGAEQTVASAGWSDTKALASVQGHFRTNTGLLSVRGSGAVQYISAQGTKFGGILTYPLDLRGSFLAGSPKI